MKNALQPIVEMTAQDDFSLYEDLVSRVMKPEDFYKGREFRQRIADGLSIGWWIRDGQGQPIAWCALDHVSASGWPGACSLIGLAVDPRYRRTKLALRLIKHIMKYTGKKPMTAYIQPGGETERWLDFFGFRLLGVLEPWHYYIRVPD